MARAETEAKNTEIESEFRRAYKIEVFLYSARLAARNSPFPLMLADQAEDAAALASNELAPIRALALAGQWDRARKIVGKLRPDPTDHAAFTRGLLKGDMALIEARAALRLSAVDDEIAGDGPLPSHIAAPLGARELLSQARTYYDAIAFVAVKEDIQLETNYYGQQLKQRHIRLANIWRALVD